MKSAQVPATVPVDVGMGHGPQMHGSLQISHTVRTEAIEEDLSPVLIALGFAPSSKTAHTSMSDEDT